MRIGLISDTHVPSAAHTLWPQVYDALRAVDLIMHAGDLYDPVVLDWLEELSPVMAVWGNGDFGGWQRTEPPGDPRLTESRVLSVDGLRIGLVHDFPLPEAPPQRTVEGLMDHFFDAPVDVLVRGNTHRAEIADVKGVLVVNPGSPTYPNHQSLRLGTIAYLDVDDGEARATIVQLA